MTKSIIITAGGKGLRMGAEIPKQFLPINNKPILFYTIEQFHQYDSGMQIILVLPSDHISYWKSLVEEHQFSIPHLIKEGGRTRYHSIKNGLSEANGDLIGVHDGVRPLITIKVISEVYESAKKNGAAIPVLPLKESVRKILPSGSSQARDRSRYRVVQTPQCFKENILRTAYENDYNELFTDDASVVEASGFDVSLVIGNDENIKITTPFDFKIAELLLPDFKS